MLARHRRELTEAVDGVRSNIHSPAVPISNHNTLGHRKPGSSTAMTCGRTSEDVAAGGIAGTAGSNPAGGRVSVLTVVRCQAEFSATGQSLTQRSPTVCVCVSVSVIRSNSKLLHSQQV